MGACEKERWALLNRYVQGESNSDRKMTIGFEVGRYYIKLPKIQATAVLQIWNMSN